jgi:hypothetical protein
MNAIPVLSFLNTASAENGLTVIQVRDSKKLLQ